MTDTKITSFKGFDKDLKCRDFQYEVGETYTHDGKVIACSSGFHACENPFDVFNYYALYSSRFAVVVQSGDVAREADGDSKLASAKITIEAELSMPDYVKRCVAWLVDKTKDAATTGDYAPAATTGYRAPAATTGDYAPAATTGNSAPAATTGDYAPSATTGYRAPAATTGDRAPAATTGDYAPAATTGYRAPAATTGDYAPAATTGNSAPAASIGRFAKAKAGAGSGLCLAEYDNNFKLIHMFASMVGQKGIKPDTWYSLKDGKPVECDQ
uniref:DUF7666 domain-containing protein n=4 Tax=Yoonia sp. TaxID=2212373 RepID=UPI00404768D8